MDYKQVKYQIHNVGAHDKRELIKATGQDYVPAIVERKQIITYPDIPDYLETIAPKPSIYPDHTRGAAKAIENWAHYRLEDIVWQYSVPEMPKTFRNEVERWVFVEMQEIKRGPLEKIEANRPVLEGEMKRHFQILEDMLAEHKFLLSESPSLADFAVFGAITPLSYSGHIIPEEFKSLNVWWSSVDKL
jgi:glutathione S-transferase